jgi:hypothetical protein
MKSESRQTAINAILACGYAIFAIYAVKDSQYLLFVLDALLSCAFSIYVIIHIHNYRKDKKNGSRRTEGSSQNHNPGSTGHSSSGAGQCTHNPRFTCAGCSSALYAGNGTSSGVIFGCKCASCYTSAYQEAINAGVSPSYALRYASSVTGRSGTNSAGFKPLHAHLQQPTNRRMGNVLSTTESDEPIRAFKSGDIYLEKGELVLKGQRSRIQVEDVAECLVANHSGGALVSGSGEVQTEIKGPIPSVDCTCGFHGVTGVSQVTRGLTVIFEVEFSGCVIVHEKNGHEYGYRAEKQRVMCVYLPPLCFYCYSSDIIKTADYFVPSWVHDPPRQFSMVCRSCFDHDNGLDPKWCQPRYTPQELSQKIGTDVRFGDPEWFAVSVTRGQ